MNDRLSGGAAHSLATPALRLAALRATMAARGIDAWLAPSADPHLSEYLPAHWQGRAWLSGFTGSAGTLVVTAQTAGLWTDSRYWVQAEAELAGSGIALMKIQAGQREPHVDWLAQQLPQGAVVGADGDALGVASAQLLAGALAARGIALATGADLLDEIWPERPALPAAAVYEHALTEATVSRGAKLALLRQHMQALGAAWHFVSTLDDIAWIFNLRGADVSYNPVFVAHALIGVTHATLFVGAGKISAALAATLAADGVELAPYTDAAPRLAALPDGATLLVDPRRVTFGLLAAATGVATGTPSRLTVIEAINPSTLEKSRKNAAQTQHIRRTMEQDGAALAEFFSAFEAALARGETLSELTVDAWLSEARSRRPGFVTLSFGTIAGFNANGAMPHYRATPTSHAMLAGDGLLLIDSGGQYLGGTTDITRVVPIGTPSAAQKRDFTVVLKGTIALSRARFPRGIRSPLLDAIARAPIWAEGIDYGHGTGHGVGYFLNVHEGPQVISFHAAPEPHTAMQAGMVTSVEPGIYRPGKWGIRIENLVMARPAFSGLDGGATRDADAGDEFGEFLEFETLTLCPIDTRCLALEVLNQEELDWLNAYHATVRERLAPLVSGAALDWLVTRTEPVHKQR